MAEARTAVRDDTRYVKALIKYGLYALAVLCIILGIALLCVGPGIGLDYAVRLSARYNDTWEALVRAGGMFYQALGVGILELGIILALVMELNKREARRSG